MAQAQADNPKSCESGAEEVHHRDNRAGRNNQRLQHASADDCPAQPAPRQSGEHDRRHGQYHAGHAGLAHRRVVDGQGNRDREPDHDRLHDQHGGEQPFRRWRVAAAAGARTLLTQTMLRRIALADGLIAGAGVVLAAARHGGHASSPMSSPTSSGAVLAGPGAGSPGVARVSSSRASPAVITDPVISRTAVPGGPPSADPASASSASPTPSSIASSSLATALTRSGPNTALASSASLAGSADRGEELAVTTSSETTGST